MSNTEFLNSIKTTVRSYLPGSSDFDLLIVTKNDIDAREKMTLESKISKSLVYSLNMPFGCFII